MSADGSGSARSGAARSGAARAAGAAGHGPAVEVDPTRPLAEQLGLTSPGEVARRAFNRARDAARSRGLRPGSTTAGRAASPDLRSGAGRDARDPVLFGELLGRVAAERGWTPELAVGGLISRWGAFVGPDVAAHCTPETFEEGLLVLRADSSAWATELHRIAPTLLRRLAEELGDDVVRDVRVVGPGGQRWGRGGRRRVPGRGPRDTYG